jgi:signal transduction histidine kinase
VVSAVAWLKALAKRHWPALRIRTILFGTLLFVAALPGVAALFLRVYENSIVQQTEAELIAQGAVLGSAYKIAWGGGAVDPAPRRLAPEPPRIDLRTMPILPPQRGSATRFAPDLRAAAAGRAVLPIASDAAAVTLTATRLLDARGVVVLGRSDVGRRLADLPEVRAALAGHAATVLRARGSAERRSWRAVLSRAYAVRVHHARPVLFGGRVIGVVLLSRSPRGLFVGLYQDAAAIGLGIALILATLLVLVALLSRGIARPIDQLARASEAVARGHLVMPDTPVTAAIEIAQLYDHFRDMAERIERRSRYLRDFAAAVSHEFKTPIAGIRGALELLEDHERTMTPADRARFLRNAGADAERLQRLVRRLLDLARADMTTVGPDATADVVAAARRVADSFRSAAFAVTVAGADAATARITPAVIETLLENSRQAGARAVAIRIATGDTLRLTVTDDGPGIAPADRERIFEPFFTGRRETGGTGLGLAIARSLLAATGGTIVMVEAGEGACFEMLLMR